MCREVVERLMGCEAEATLWSPPEDRCELLACPELQFGRGRTVAPPREVTDAEYGRYYCDAVAITIGGSCFLKVFSHFFRTRSNDQYYVPRNQQLVRRHPVTWLRTKMLVDRARKLGMTAMADGVEKAWAETARVLGVHEDYEGTWADEFFAPLRQMLDDMIEESQPFSHQPSDVNLPGAEEKSLSPIQLCNLSWAKFETDRKSYRTWEKGAIDSFLRGA